MGHSDKQFKRALFIFRRDLRLYDNHALLQAIKQSEQVVPCFIFDPRQVGPQNKYRSMHALQFMVEALADLDAQLRAQAGRLYLLYGKPSTCIDQLLQEIQCDAIFYNRDYTPFSRRRDAAIKKISDSWGVPVFAYNDILLHEPELILTGSGTPYKTYTPFVKAARKLSIEKPRALPTARWYTAHVRSAETDRMYTKIVSKPTNLLAVSGDKRNATRVLRSCTQFTHYAKERNILSKSTTLMSPYLKFGLLSVRQVYYRLVAVLGSSSPLIAQLYWRDFFTYQLFHTPQLLGHAGVAQYDKIRWSYNKKHFARWCEGKTGFPLVDAGMRELNATGFMHNRVRMITASFLVKDLHIDWRWRERYFAQKLVDYDPAVNNGNWQWVASTGTCAQSYFRIFNPWIQQKKYDPACMYIKKWVPELADVPPRILHTLFKCAQAIVQSYPLPMIVHEDEAKKAVAIFKKASGK